MFREAITGRGALLLRLGGHASPSLSCWGLPLRQALARPRQTTLIGELAKSPMAVPKVFIRMDPARLDLVTQLRGINPRRGIEITPLGAHKVTVFTTLWADNYPIPF